MKLPSLINLGVVSQMAVSGLACVAIGYIVTDEAVATSAAGIRGVKVLLVRNGAMATM